MRQKVKDIALGFFMVSVGFAAFFQLAPFDPIWKYTAICVVMVVSFVATMIFFTCSGNRL